MCSIEIEILFTALGTHALHESTLQYVIPFHRIGGDTSYMEQEHYQILESSISFTGTLLRLPLRPRLFAPWGIKHHPHT